MSRLAAILCCFLLVSCGFAPVYGTASHTNKQAESSLDQVAISLIPDREGQFLRNALMDRFYRGGEPRNPSYQLIINKIKEEVSDFDITVESEATRRQLRLTSNLKLIDKKTGDVVLTRSLLAITSHNVLESEFSTLVTEQSAREAALNDIARQVERHLTLFFTR